MSLGLIPDYLFNEPMQALHTPGPGNPGPLGLHMVDTTNLRGRGGCIGCGVPGMHAGPVAEAHLGYVMVDESPLGATTGGVLATIAVVLGLGAGIGAGVYALKRRRRR